MLSAKAIKVELYDKDGDKIRVFYIGGQANEAIGTYMLMEGADRPYIVQIPGFEGYVLPRFSPRFLDWRDKGVFNATEEDVKTVVIVTVDPELSKGLQFNERRAKTYSKYFGRLFCEGYINGTMYLDSVIRTAKKRCTVDMESWSGQKQHLEVYWMEVNKRSKNKMTPFPGSPDEYDADRFYATMNDFKDTVIIQRQMFEKIFRKGYEFFQQDDTTSKPVEHIPAGTGSIKMKP
jgi:hypothetical protein